MRRSLGKLREALRYANIEEGDEDFYSLLQYNPPYTLPQASSKRGGCADPNAVRGEGASPAAASEAGRSKHRTARIPIALRARTAMSSGGARRIDGSDWAVRSIYALHRWMAVLYMPSAISQGGWLCFIYLRELSRGWLCFGL